MRCPSFAPGSLLIFSAIVTFHTIAAEPAWDTAPDTWAATDALGRALPMAGDAPAPRADRTVGVFYFLWLGEHSRTVYDNSKLLAGNPGDPRYGPAGAFHHWGEPLFGYYKSDDRAVIRKHLQMLTDAGVDVLFLDVTNALTYDAVYLSVCEEIDRRRLAGMRYPRVAFVAHAKEQQVVARLYDTFYAKGLHSEAWFMWRGKPLVLARVTDQWRADVRAFFTFRESWAWANQKWFGDGRDKWCWIDHAPQTPGWHDAPGEAEQISVKVAGHPTDNLGRSYHGGRQPGPGQLATADGPCFAEQWRRALDVDPQLVFVTGWNEWVAQRFTSTGGGRFLGKPLKKGDSFFVDQFSQEFSRDIEPMAGGHGDDYYCQLAAAVRRYKGVRPIPALSPQPIRIDGDFADWARVGPEYRDDLGDPVRRDHQGFDKAAPPYVNTTGRNDIACAKVSYDAANVYFYVRTREPLTPPADPNWMLLYIDADGDPKTGWLGYDLIVNRTGVRPTRTTAERNVGGKYAWDGPVEIDLRTAGNEIELALPRGLFGDGKSLPKHIDFKWADNIRQTGEASDFTLNGDAAPNDRFNYRAVP